MQMVSLLDLGRGGRMIENSFLVLRVENCGFCTHADEPREFVSISCVNELLIFCFLVHE